MWNSNLRGSCFAYQSAVDELVSEMRRELEWAIAVTRIEVEFFDIAVLEEVGQSHPIISHCE